MLVNMGDLPKPESDVLSESLTSKIRKHAELESSRSNSSEGNSSKRRQQTSSLSSTGESKRQPPSQPHPSMLPLPKIEGAPPVADGGEYIFDLSSSMKNYYFPTGGPGVPHSNAPSDSLGP